MKDRQDLLMASGSIRGYDGRQASLCVNTFCSALLVLVSYPALSRLYHIGNLCLFEFWISHHLTSNEKETKSY
jgi:hypothetical protein